jgi:hypothetical protein
MKISNQGHGRLISEGNIQRNNKKEVHFAAQYNDFPFPWTCGTFKKGLPVLQELAVLKTCQILKTWQVYVTNSLVTALA